MFAFVEGSIDYLDPELCVVDAGGWGVNVNISVRTMQRLPGIGEHVKLYTHTSLREDAIALYGFLSRDDLDMFRKLLGVSGVGPKAALSILSELDPDELRFAILSGDAKAIAKAQGVGAKTAQRVLLELKDKVKLSEDKLVSGVREGMEGPEIHAEGLSPEKQDAIAALVALGYSQTESRRAVSQVPDDSGMDSGQLLGAALKFMI